MKLSLCAKYTKLPDNIKTAESLSRFLITEALERRFPQGMPRTESRIYAKILDQFYLETKEIEISDEAFLLIKESLDQTSLPASMSSWKWALLEHLDRVAGKKE